MSEHYLDVVRKVLDSPLIDANHNNCGKVDDIELDLGGEPKIVALLIGNEYTSDRLPEARREHARQYFDLLREGK